jgi:hypothetical protein
MQTNLRLWIACLLMTLNCFGQNEVDNKKSEKISKLFSDDKVLAVQMSYSNKELKKATNDSTYINSQLTYVDQDSIMELPVRIRARGNFRRENCYFAPVKIRIKKGDAKGTLFKGNKELKLVLPCLREKYANDDVIKEFIAYKLYEVVSPYHFKTRLLNFTLNEPRGKKVNELKVKAFLIEDMDELEDRFGAKTMKRNVHPLQQDSLFSIRNSFFQYMIGNTDFSTGYQHNQKLLFVNGSSIPIAYDFDMSGFCNVSYAVVAKVGESALPISNVKQRLYRGFQRSDATMFAIRDEFLKNQSKMLAIVDNHKGYFENEDDFETTKEYLLEFFATINNPSKFKSEILDKRRTK